METFGERRLAVIRCFFEKQNDEVDISTLYFTHEKVFHRLEHHWMRRLAPTITPPIDAALGYSTFVSRDAS
jgi:hypothetical protein